MCIRDSTSGQLSQSLPRVCCESIAKILSFKEGEFLVNKLLVDWVTEACNSCSSDDRHHKILVFQRMLDHAYVLRSASRSLEDAFDRYAPTPDLNCEWNQSLASTMMFYCHNFYLYWCAVPFSETSEVRTHTLALYSSLELMLECAKSLWEQCHTHSRLITPTSISTTLMEQSCDQLLSTISQQTALYCSKLLQVFCVTWLNWFVYS